MQLTLILALLLAGCAGLTTRAYLPPDELLERSYTDTILVRGGDSPEAFGFASTAQQIPSLHMCLITLPKHASQITRDCLFVSELGNCKGAQDVNRVPVRDRVPPPGYERTCAAVDITAMAKRLKSMARWATPEP